MRMFDKRLAQHGEYFGQGVTLPNSGTKALDGGPACLSGAAGGTGVTIHCKTAVAIPTGKKLQLIIEDCDTKGGTFKESCSVTFHKGTYAAGEHLGEVVLPSQAKKFVRGKLVSDGNCTGTVDVYPYLTR
ncbi:hypothetical protein [Halodesulfovibrio sp.]|uniref:hypothetical protein n=1 Tax=Halodesulfovibrio sp. TaxID=1912772 RepID=UPI0025F8C475|nr:hypothetical protein [Halodesulfovibrio sp.]MCT4626975.1 hypothetical protein [Halodesulfovibrio sp.]